MIQVMGLPLGDCCSLIHFYAGKHFSRYSASVVLPSVCSLCTSDACRLYRLWPSFRSPVYIFSSFFFLHRSVFSFKPRGQQLFEGWELVQLMWKGELLLLPQLLNCSQHTSDTATSFPATKFPPTSWLHWADGIARSSPLALTLVLVP